MSNVVDNIENMNKRTKMILSIVGVCAVIIPALLLWFLSSHVKQEPQISKSSRPVDALNVQTSAGNKPVPTPFVLVSTPAPVPASSSATTKQSTSSAK